MGQQHFIQVSMPKPLKERIDQQAASRGLKKAPYIRMVLIEHLEKTESSKQVKTNEKT